MNKRRIAVLSTVAVTSSLLIGVLGASGSPAQQQKPKKAPVVLGSSSSLKFNLGTDNVILLTPPSSPDVFIPTRIVSTAKLPRGHYEVTATATGSEAVCWLGTKAEPYTAGSPRQISVNTSGEDGGLALTAGVKVHKNKRVSEYCGGVESGGLILSGGITAIKVNKNLVGKAGVDNGVGGIS
jgi:hypothetical protein